MVTIQALKEELCGLIRGVPAFSASGFSVFDVDDFTDATELQTYPVAGVMYDGSLPQEGGRNSVIPVSSGSSAVALVTRQFSVIVAVEYRFAGTGNSVGTATDLMEQVCSVVMGYKGINSRPWRFIVEKPEVAVSGGGLVFYSQVWQTDVVVRGDSVTT